MVNCNPNDYSTDYRFRIFVVDAGGTNLRRIDHNGDQEPPGTGAQFPKWCSDGKYVEYEVVHYVGAPAHPVYSRHQASVSEGMTISIPDAPKPNEIYLPWNSPDGKHTFLLWGELEKQGLVIAKPDGSEERMFAEDLYHVHEASWLPDNSAIMFHARSENNPDAYYDLW